MRRIELGSRWAASSWSPQVAFTFTPRVRFFLGRYHHGEPLAVAASTPARMSDRPLVYYAARCSGGTAIHAILRDLLVLHGVRLFAARRAARDHHRL